MNIKIELQTNKKGYIELLNKIQNEMNHRKIHGYIEELYDDNFIYQKYSEELGTEYYRQSYEVDKDGDVKLNGIAKPVEKQISYNNEKKEVNSMSDEKKKTPCAGCMEKIVGLINNKQTRFGKEDREWLLEQEESVLDKLMPVEPEPIQVNREQALDVLKEEFTDVQKVIELLPAKVKEKIEKGLAVHASQRKEKVDKILANTKEVWTEDDLNGFSDEMLEKLEKSIKPVENYSGMGGVPKQENQSKTSSDKVLYLPGDVKPNEK